MNDFRLSSSIISRKTRKDKVLSRVFAAVLSGNWTVSNYLKLFFEKRNEFSICLDCLVWGPRIVIPEVLRGTLLNELHLGHLGIVKMKKVARSYAWWPGIDKDIEILIKSSNGCLRTRNKPSPMSLHPWQLAERPRQRIHIDFVGPFLQQMFLIVFDSFSKWPEVIVLKSTTATKTNDELRCLFSRWGIPE